MDLLCAEQVAGVVALLFCTALLLSPLCPVSVSCPDRGGPPGDQPAHGAGGVRRRGGEAHQRGRAPGHHGSVGDPLQHGQEPLLVSPRQAKLVGWLVKKQSAWWLARAAVGRGGCQPTCEVPGRYIAAAGSVCRAELVIASQEPGMLLFLPVLCWVGKRVRLKRDTQRGGWSLFTPACAHGSRFVLSIR